MQQALLNILDFVLLPFVLILVYGIAYRYRNKHFSIKNPLRKYFIPAFTVKVCGAIFIGLVYALYYKGGDTFSYFYHARIINSSFSQSPALWLKLITHTADYNTPEAYDYVAQMYWYNSPSEYSVSSIAAVIGVFTFNTYLPTAVLFAALSFTGVWLLYKTFVDMYPQLHKPIAVAILFIPSTFVWGSGIFKDTITYAALGWMTYASFRLFQQKDFSVRNILLLIFSFILLAKIKIYILLAFLPAVAIWQMFYVSKRIVNKGQRILIKVLFVGVGVACFLFFSQRFSKELDRYSLENIAMTAQTTRGWIGYVSEIQEGSSYDLGSFDPSITGMLKKFPAAVIVTLFRPFPWEAGKVIVFLSVLEALVFIFITLKVLLLLKLRKFVATIGSDPTIQFCLIFSIIFAFAVGISSYNFGALSRYKIPALPFYSLSIFLIWYKNKKGGENLLPFV